MKLWGITHRGAVRQQNQDAYAVRELEDGRGLAVVCDGMGGARAGNVASSMAVELFMNKLAEQGQPGDDPQKWLKTAAAHANDGVFQKAVDDPDCTGMGTTLVAALVGTGTPFSSTRGTAGPITSPGMASPASPGTTPWWRTWSSGGS